MLRTIKSKSFTAKLLNSDTFSISYHSHAVLSQKELLEGYRSFIELGQGQPLKSLVVVGDNAYLDTELHSCPPDRMVKSKAKAIVTNNLAIRLAVNLNMVEENAPEQVKVFADQKSAITWLKAI